MNKTLVWWFGSTFFVVLLSGMLMQSPEAALQATPPQPLGGLISGVLYGTQFGLSIPLVAWLTRHFSSKDLYFVIIFAVECGLTLGEGVLFGVWGFPLAGLLFVVGKIIPLCIIYTLTCRWWKKQPG